MRLILDHKELKTLRLLMDNPKGLHWVEMALKLEEYIGRGAIHPLLKRLVERGFIRKVQEKATQDYQIASARYVITETGNQAVICYCSAMGPTRVKGNEMKLWLLEVRYDLPGNENPWTACDQYRGFVIRADTEIKARQLAAFESGDDWINPGKSTCIELFQNGIETIILSDFYNA